MTRFTCLVAAVLLLAIPSFAGDSQAPEPAAASEDETQEETLTTAEATVSSREQAEGLGLCLSSETSMLSTLPFPIETSILPCSGSQEQACAPCACVVIRNEPQCFC